MLSGGVHEATIARLLAPDYGASANKRQSNKELFMVQFSVPAGMVSWEGLPALLPEA